MILAYVVEGRQRVPYSGVRESWSRKRQNTSPVSQSVERQPRDAVAGIQAVAAGFAGADEAVHAPVVVVGVEGLLLVGTPVVEVVAVVVGAYAAVAQRVRSADCGPSVAPGDSVGA